MKHTSIPLGFKRGPAYATRKDLVFDKWKIKNIPVDIDDGIVLSNVKHFFQRICALEIPSSLKCNCDCVYCYIREGCYKNKTITVKQINELLSHIKKMFTFDDKLTIKYLASWGAEPLCDLDTLAEMYRFAKLNDCYLGFSTNGTNCSDKAFDLIKNIIKNNNSLTHNGGDKTIQISIDGPAEIQDKNRPLKNGKGSFEVLHNFIKMFEEMEDKFFDGKMMHHFLGTATMESDESCNDYLKAFDWFAKNTEYKATRNSFLSPIRLENHISYDLELKNKFVDMSKRVYELIKSYDKPCMDYYTAMLFDRRIRNNGRVLCSSCNTQISVDIDGSIYACHGYLSNYKIKPLGYLGNVFEGSLDYSGMVCNVDKMNSTFIHKAICHSCPLSDPKISGFICFSCPPSYETLSGLAVPMDYFKCEAYRESLSYWEKTYDTFKEKM